MALVRVNTDTPEETEQEHMAIHQEPGLLEDPELLKQQPIDPGQLAHEERPALEYRVMGTPEREFLRHNSLSQEPEDESAGENQFKPAEGLQDQPEEIEQKQSSKHGELEYTDLEYTEGEYTESEYGETHEVDPEQGDERSERVQSYLHLLERSRRETERLEQEQEQEWLAEELHLKQHQLLSPGLQTHPPPPEEPNRPDSQGQGEAPSNLIENRAAVAVTPDCAPESDQEIAPEESARSRAECSVTQFDLQNLQVLSANQPDVPPTNPPADLAAARPEKTPTPERMEILFWSFERDQWRVADRLTVNSLNPSLVERVAKKYTWKDWSLYDQNLWSLTPAQYFKAATGDRSNAVYLISVEEEKKLAAKERLIMDKEFLASVSMTLGESEEVAEDEEAPPTKRQRH